jgi:hypothetical protein
MPRKLGMNRHQKAAHKRGEPQIGREQIQEMLALSTSEDAEDRLEAASNLCPCHVRTRIPEVWEALYRMMEDEDSRVRQAAWHTIEDGGKPGDEAGELRLERLCDTEQDPRVRKFAEATLRKIGCNRKERLKVLDRLAVVRPVRRRDKCDFCGGTDLLVEIDPQTMIPADPYPRAALICDACARIA